MKLVRSLFAGILSLLTFCGAHSAHAGVIAFGSGANQFNMDFVPIGSPGNLADTTGDPNPAGAVGYDFQMGTYEVSRDMITKANAAGSLGITLFDMSSVGGNGVDKPANGVSWNEAARFVNWLNTSTGGFAAYKFTTSDVNDNIALWTAADTLDFDSSNPFRSKRTNYVLPTINEWYKAAYFNPLTSTYFDFPNGLNTPPTAVAGGTTADTAVHEQPVSQGPATINNAGGLSPFGVMGLGGNVFEWNETESDLVNDNSSSARVLRGGAWFNTDGTLSSSFRLFLDPANENPIVGFRVASLSSSAVVPEPGSLAIWGMICMSGLLYGGRRVRK